MTIDEMEAESAALTEKIALLCSGVGEMTRSERKLHWRLFHAACAYQDALDDYVECKEAQKCLSS